MPKLDFQQEYCSQVSYFAEWAALFKIKSLSSKEPEKKL